jgi:hypothetical protein
LELLLTSEHGMSACAAGFASGADVCGGEWEERPWPHFSGNMWTAKCSYIVTLPPPTSLLPITHSNWGRMEAWVGSGQDVVVWHLGSAYTGHKYIQMPRYASRGIDAFVRIATCVRPTPRHCRPDINLLAHVYHLTSQLLHITVRLPCACVRHVTRDDLRVMLVSALDSDWRNDIGVIHVDRDVDGGPLGVCSFSRSFPVVLHFARPQWMYLEVSAWVQYDFGTHQAGARDSRQV